MKRLAFVLGLITACLMFTTPALAGDCKGCARIEKTGSGFCDHCGHGKIFGVEITHRVVYDALAGDEGLIEHLKQSGCPGCKKAAETDGACESCHIYVANGRVYLSPVAHALARGKVVDQTHAMKCPQCAKFAKAHEGFCSACGAGFVANRRYESKSFYESAKTAYETILAAVKDASHCEQCAAARLTDGECKACKKKFKNGKPVS